MEGKYVWILRCIIDNITQHFCNFISLDKININFALFPNSLVKC